MGGSAASCVAVGAAATAGEVSACRGEGVSGDAAALGPSAGAGGAQAARARAMSNKAVARSGRPVVALIGRSYAQAYAVSVDKANL